MSAGSTPDGHGHEGAGEVLRPVDLAESAEGLRSGRGSVLIRGAGTKQGWAGAVRAPEVVLETTGMDQVITHNAADMTVSVQAGIPLRRLQEHVAADGQWVALDPPSASGGATVGGLLAAGDSGPSRQRYGGLRDLVIGATVVLADGSVGRSGGHVIKNVAGYDLAKLMHGSLGSLALVAEVVLRLHPVPATRITVQASADARVATEVVLALAAGPCEPARIAWSADAGEQGTLLVGVEGAAGAAEAAAERVGAALADHGLHPAALTPQAADRAWTDHEAEVTGTDGETVLALNGLPSGLATVAEVVRHVAREAGVTARVVSWAGQGMHVVRFGQAEPEQYAHAVRGVRHYADQARSSTMLRRRPEEVDAHLEVMGSPPPSVGVLRAIKAQFDPGHRLAPGRFAGWYEQPPTLPASGRRGSA